MKRRICISFCLFFTAVLISACSPIPSQNDGIGLSVLKTKVNENPSKEMKDVYFFGTYMRNAILIGERFFGGGFWEELSFEEREMRMKRFNVSSPECFEFVFRGTKYLFSLRMRGLFGTSFFSWHLPSIYGGENYGERIKTFFINDPRKYCREGLLFEITRGDENFLVVLVGRRHAATLWILDREFNEIYREEFDADPSYAEIFKNDAGDECFFVDFRGGDSVIYKFSKNNF